MSFNIIHNDITRMKTDAIVNAANSQLLAGGGVCGAIFNRAGVDALSKECRSLAPIKTGEAVITKGYNLDSKYIIHAVGPVYQDGKSNERTLLKNAYMNSLKLAYKYKLESISFPLISAGIYGYPKAEALEVANEAIKEFLMKHDMEVYLVLYDRDALEISYELYDDIKHYIDTYYEEEIRYENVFINKECARVSSLDDLLDNMQPSFSQLLFHYIDRYQYNDVDVYKNANIDRKLFSKLKNKDYHPSKKTVLALCISLKLSLDEAIDLLDSAGYSLSQSQIQDIIIRYFIENEIYDIYLVNETLFKFHVQTL